MLRTRCSSRVCARTHVGMCVRVGYRAEPGKQNSTTLPREGWEAIVRLVKDGTVPGFLASYDTIPLSASALKGGE
jgi:hypothetical protein